MLTTVLKKQTAGVVPPKDLTLPLNTILDIDHLETLLKDQDYKNEMIVYLGTVGGCDVQTTTRRVMSSLLVNSLALQLSWKGSGEKRSFQDLILCKVVIAAVHRSAPEQVTNAAVEAAIKVWLRNARDRDGGRKERMLRRHTQNQV
ncbi:uncharacterized protein LOC143482221 [Brachyhypopomus gauderio]|uniref:uncharacterized protein LOC143482221 n=1 Tax=Brachyhypopomus gauderio TaxID=698409 RepID=UPI004042CFCE